MFEADLDLNEQFENKARVEDKRHKSFAPIDPRINQLPKVENKFLERGKKINATYARQAEMRKDLQMAASLLHKYTTPKREQKDMNKTNALRRIEQRPSDYVTKPANLSPILDLEDLKSPYWPLSPEERLHEYNRRHKCQHGNTYTSYNIRYKTDSKNEMPILAKLLQIPYYMEVKCHCDHESVIPRSVAEKCGHCTAIKLSIVTPAQPYKQILYCTYCKNKQYWFTDEMKKDSMWEYLYKDKEWTRVRLPCFEKHIKIEEKPISQPVTEGISYASMAQREAGVFDMAAEGADLVKNFIGKVLEAVKYAYDCVKVFISDIHYCMQTLHTVRTTIDSIWTTIITILEELLDSFLRYPLSHILHFFYLLTSDSATERIVHFLAILGSTTINKAFKQLMMLLGLPDCFFTTAGSYFNSGVLNQTNAETIRSDINYRAKRDQWVKDMIPTANRESGTCLITLISKLFGFGSNLSNYKPILEAMKNFNTIFASWKNLHQLVENLLGYLPDFMTTIFTATDPMKRYARDSKTPGNPIYETRENLTHLTTGENHFKSDAYDQFIVSWRAAQKHILENYHATPAVLNLHEKMRSLALNTLEPKASGERKIPFVLTLMGPPGQGKSTVWPLLLSGIVGGSGHNTIKDIKDMTYTRNTDSDYMDGYNAEKHKIFQYDDFAKNMDDECVDELMSIVSPVQYLPQFASLDNLKIGMKGACFQAPIVVICTNFSDFRHCKSLVELQALYRRLGFIVRWEERFDANTTMFTLDKAIPGTGTDLHKQPIYNDVGDSVLTNKRFFTLQQLIKKLQSCYVEHFAQQVRVQDCLEKVISKDYINFVDVANGKTAVLAHREDGIIDWHDLIYVAGKVTLDVLGTTSYMLLLDQITRKVSKHCTVFQQYCIGASLVLASAFLFYKLIFPQYQGWTVTHESGEIHTRSNNAVQTRTARAPLFKPPPQAVRQVGDINATSIHKIIMMNQMIAVDQNDRFVNALMLRGKTMLVVRHFIDKCTTLRLFSSRSTDPEVCQIEVDDCKVYHIPNVDLSLVELPNSVAMFRDILSHVVNRPLKKKTQGWVTRRIQCDTPVLFQTEISPSKERVSYNDDGKIVYEVADLTYDFKHSFGDCGNLLLAQVDDGLKIVGFHQSGMISSDKSYAIQLLKYELEQHLNSMSSETTIQLENGFLSESVEYEDNMIGPNKVEYVATCRQHITSSGKTDLIPSKLFDQITLHATRPAVLRRTNGIDPQTKALNKFGLSAKQYPQRLVKQAVQSIIEELMQYKEPTDICRELTLHEALNGIPGEIDSVDTSSSSGYPFSLSHLRGAKRRVLDGEPGQLSLSEPAAKDFQRWQALIDQGIVPSDPFLATLKDERRLHEKVDACKTRLFCAGSLSGFMHNKIAFGGFSNFFKRIRGKTFSTLGINRASQEWHEMVNYLREVGYHGIDGDQADWDGRVKAGIAMSMLEIFDAFYGKEGAMRRKILFLHAVFPHLRITTLTEEGFKSYLLRILGCMPSGWYLTFVGNSLINAILMRIAWIELVSAPYNDLYYFRKFVRDKYAGDDEWLVVADEFLEEYNGETLEQHFAKYEQIFTAADKGKPVKYKDIQYCAFLKTTTGELYNRYVPHFDMVANLETINWIRKCDDEEKATEDNCNDALRNLFFYGEEIYNEYRNKILSLKPAYQLINYYALEESFLGYGAIPDPYGTFGYTRTTANSPRSLYAALEKIAPHRDSGISSCASRESGSGLTKMSMREEQPIAGDVAQPATTSGVESNLDDSTPQLTTKAGVSLAEQQQVVIRQAVDGNLNVARARFDAHLNEQDWDLKKMLLRNNLVAAFQWSLTDAVTTNLPVVGTSTVTNVPFDLLQNDIVSSPFQRFHWFRCEKIKLRIQISASRFHQGRLGIWFHPTMLPSTAIEVPTRSATWWTQLQHGYLDPSNGTVLDFEIPFQYHKGWIDLEFGDCLGQLYVTVLNQLQAATGSSSSVEVKIFVSFENAVFKVPRPGGASYLKSMIKTLESKGFQLTKKETAQREAGIFKGLGNELDNIIDSVIPKDITGGIAQVLLDKPAVSDVPVVLTNKEQQYLSHSRGVEHLERMTLEPSAQFITADQFGTDVDETDINYMLRKRVLLKTISWSATQPVGTVLYSTIVSPTHFLKGYATPAGEIFDPTPIGMISSLFTYWRGSIDLIFQIVGTGFHEGRLDFCNHPGELTPPSDYAASMSQYVVSQTIRNTNNAVEVRIPFHSDTPWKRIWNGEILSDSYTVDAGIFRALDYITGSFTLRVAVPLKNPPAVIGAVDINILVCAGSDFELNTLSPWGNQLIIVTPEALQRDHPKALQAVQRKARDDRRRFEEEDSDDSIRVVSRAQREAGTIHATDLNTDTKDDVGIIPLGFGSVYTHDMPVPHFGETYRNLRECAKRYVYPEKRSTQVDGSTGSARQYFNDYYIDTTTLHGMIGLLFSMFRLFRGPMNFKIDGRLCNWNSASPNQQVYNDQWQGYVTTVPFTPAGGDVVDLQAFISGDGNPHDNRTFTMPLIRFSNQQVAEFQLPFQSIYHSLLVPNAFDVTEVVSGYYCNCFFRAYLIASYNITMYGNTQARLDTSMVASIGDETRFGVFMGMPQVRMDADSNVFPNPSPSLMLAYPPSSIELKQSDLSEYEVIPPKPKDHIDMKVRARSNAIRRN